MNFFGRHLGFLRHVLRYHHHHYQQRELLSYNLNIFFTKSFSPSPTTTQPEFSFGGPVVTYRYDLLLERIAKKNN